MKKLFLTIIIALGTINFVGCGDNTPPKEEVKVEQQEVVQEEQEQEQEEVKEEKTLKVGDTYKNEMFSVSIDKVATTKQRNKYSDVKANKVIVIDYTYNNIDYLEDNLYLFQDYFKAYDSNGEILENYEVIDYKYPKEISKGKKCKAQMVFAYNGKDGKIDLELNDTLFNGKPIAIWKLKIK